MPTKEDNAALSSLVYNDVRGYLNNLSTPNGWALLPGANQSESKEANQRGQHRF